MKNYNPKKGWFIYTLILCFFAISIGLYLLDAETFNEKPLILLPLIVPLAGILWIYFDTRYWLENGVLYYKSAFIKGKIAVTEIHEIVKGETMWVGVKPAMAQGGLIIKYNKYKQVYLAPESNDELVDDLIELNPSIKVVSKEKREVAIT